MSNNIFHDQARMMLAFHQTVDQANPEQATLYLNMMVEELGETLIAANPKAQHGIKALIQVLHDFAEYDAIRADTVLVFDGLLDVLVVTTNAGLSLDLPMEAGWNEVYKSNMAKIDPTTGKVIKNAAGKVQKPEGWEKPNLLKVMRDAIAKGAEAEMDEPTLVPGIHGGAQVIPSAAEEPELIAGLSLSDRYLNLAMICIGECLTTLGNLRQRKVPAGPEYVEVTIGLSRACAAMSGKTWEPPIGVIERDELREAKEQIARVLSIAEVENLTGDNVFTDSIIRAHGYNAALKLVKSILHPPRKSGN